MSNETPPACSVQQSKTYNDVLAEISAPDRREAATPKENAPAATEATKKKQISGNSIAQELSTLPRTAPAALRDLPCWLVWRFEQRDGEPKPRKVPHYARTGARRRGTQGGVEDRKQLVTFSEAAAAAMRGKFDGVGLAMLPEWGIVALDFDHCIVEGGVHPEVERLVAGTYAEYSPSGNGVRAFMRGDLGNHKDSSAPFGFETFSSNGFVTYTGNHLVNTDLLGTADTIADVTDDVRALAAARFGRTATQEDSGDPLMAYEPPVGLRIDQARHYVALADNEDYNAWLKVGMALHHEFAGSVEALALWDEWSSSAANYAGPDDLGKRWEGFGTSGRRPTTMRWLMGLAKEKREAAQVAESQISFVDFSALAFGKPPPRQWIVKEWVPRGAVTALFGRGGHGKSLLAQQMAVAVSNGLDFLGISTMSGPVLGLFCEDEYDELMRRGDDLLGAAMLEPPEGCKGLFLDARAGRFNTLVTFGPDRLPVPTTLMVELRKQCEAIRPALVILDNIAQLFAGQENVRSEVTSFCNELTGIARAFNCAVLLLGHTAKIDGSEYSGSTAWDAAVRSRLFFERQDDDTTVLKKSKANYAALDEIRVEYRAGAFFPLPAGNDINPATVDAAKALIAKAIEVFTSRQQATSHLPTARNYLIKVMKAEHMLGGIAEKIAHGAMVAMIDAGELAPNSILPWKTSSRHPVQGLAVAKQ